MTRSKRGLRPMAMPRRTFLRGLFAGAAVSVALPTLEVMLGPHGEALADGEPLPTRFGVWFWGNGVRPEQWVPAQTGVGWTPSNELAPLAGLQDYVSVVSGCHVKTGTHPHHSGMTGVMTGSPLLKLGDVRDTIVSTFAHPSVDVLAADHFDGQAPFRSLEIGITRFRGTDEGTTFQHLSHNGPNNPNPAEYLPTQLYKRLFAIPLQPQVDLARRSVLDAVMTQIKGLDAKVGHADRVRLEQHFESVRVLEERLATEPPICEIPDGAPVDFPDVDGKEQIEQQNEAMSDLLALALSCDLTRVFSVLFSPAGSGVIIWQAGASNSLHQICHDEALPQPTVHAATTFTMGQLAGCLQRLKDTPEGAGNLLDQCSILCTSELADGWNHQNFDLPILVAGKGGGRLKGGVHYRSPNEESVTRGVLTALRGADVPAASFGHEDGYTTESIAALET